MRVSLGLPDTDMDDLNPASAVALALKKAEEAHTLSRQNELAMSAHIAACKEFRDTVEKTCGRIENAVEKMGKVSRENDIDIYNKIFRVWVVFGGGVIAILLGVAGWALAKVLA